MTLPATVAVDIGGTKIRAGSVIGGVLRHVRHVPTPAAEGAAAVLDTVAEVVAAVIAESHASRAADSAAGSGLADAGSVGGDSARVARSSVDLDWRIGIASAGVINPATGVVVSATESLAGWAGTELTAELESRTGQPVRAVNDVHAHALGEAAAGASRGMSSSLLVAAGTGIGGGAIISGSLLTGRNSAAGHIGHVPSSAAAGLLCPCGGTGHLEAIASGPAILATYQRLLRGDDSPASPASAAVAASGSSSPASASSFRASTSLSSASGTSSPASATLPPASSHASAVRPSPSVPASTRELAAAASAGDTLAVRAFDTGARALGAALGGIVNVLSPEVVVIGGGLADMDDTWWAPLCEAMTVELIPATAEVELRKAELGQDAALIGAAGLWGAGPIPRHTERVPRSDEKEETH